MQRFASQKLRWMVIGAQAVAALFQRLDEGVDNGELQVQRQVGVDNLLQWAISLRAPLPVTSQSKRT